MSELMVSDHSTTKPYHLGGWIQCYQIPEQLPYTPEISPLNPVHKKLISGLWWSAGFNEATTHLDDALQIKNHRRLIRHILQFGGEEVCMALPEPELDELRERGVFLYGATARLEKMEPSACHWNCAKLWFEHPQRYQLMTGYALSIDGMWRQHTWCIDTQKGELLETTTSRLAYFGFLLHRGESEDFTARHTPRHEAP